jgi:hypothetical protein
MGRFLAVFLLAAGVAAAPAEAPLSEGPDGLLVLAVVGREDSPAAVYGERAMVADPRTGETRARLLPGGTLCHGALLAVGERVVYSGYRAPHAVALSLPLTLAGPPRSLGEADTVTPSATPGRLWLGRWAKPGAAGSRVLLREVDAADGAAASGTATGNQASRAGRRLPAVSRTGGQLPRWSSVHAALHTGFLVGSGRRLTLWDRGFDRPLRGIRNGWPIAAGRSSFAWCDPRCESGAPPASASSGHRPESGCAAQAARSPPTAHDWLCP